MTWEENRGLMGTIRKDLPSVKSGRWRPSIPATVFMDSLGERATSACELGIPVIFSAVDEVEDGMSAV